LETREPPDGRDNRTPGVNAKKSTATKRNMQRSNISIVNGDFSQIIINP